MSSRLQLDMRNLSLGRRHLVNAYEVKAGIGVIAGNTVCVIHAWAPWVWYTTKSVLYKYTYLYLLPLPTHEWRPCCRSGRALRDTAASVILACANPPPSGLPHLHLQLFCPRLRPDRSTTSASTAVLSTAAARPAKTTYTNTPLIVLRRHRHLTGFIIFMTYFDI